MTRERRKTAWTGLGTAMGMGVGTAIGVSTNTMSTWMILGGGLGALLGGIVDAMSYVRNR